MAAPTLTSAQVTFQTRDDDKQKDSIIEVVVKDAANNLVARSSDSYGQFNNNTTNGPFPLQVLNQAPKPSVQTGGTVVVNWMPTPANDEWHFDMFMDLVFSDGSHVAVSENTLRLDPGSTQISLGV